MDQAVNQTITDERLAEGGGLEFNRLHNRLASQILFGGAAGADRSLRRR